MSAERTEQALGIAVQLNMLEEENRQPAEELLYDGFVGELE